MLGRQLIQLATDLRAEIGESLSPAQGVDRQPVLKYYLRRVQEMLYDGYDWPHLRMRPEVKLQAGGRYYDFPDDFNFTNVEDVWLWGPSGGRPYSIERGIGQEQFTVYRPGQRTDPVQRWDMLWTGTETQIEVWPVPNVDGYILQFVGKRNLRPLIADSDLADLDDIMIVLFAAAELMVKKHETQARAKQSLAQDRLHRMRGRLQGGSKPIQLGGINTELQMTQGRVLRAPR